MSHKSAANTGKHTEASVIRARILDPLKGAKRLVRASSIGYAAYPDYRFRSPQGAAFAVQRHLQALVKEGVVRWDCNDFVQGYQLTGKPMPFGMTTRDDL